MALSMYFFFHIAVEAPKAIASVVRGSNLDAEPPAAFASLDVGCSSASGSSFEDDAESSGVGCSSTSSADDLAAGRGAASVADGTSGSRRTSRSASQQVVTARLLIDCMGHYSPIVKQIRGRAKPEGVVLVVGSCAQGYPAEKNVTADLLYTHTNVEDDMQLFWEAFPADGGAARTTYMFSYSDADPARPSLEQLLDSYLQLLAAYQDVPLDSLTFRRVLFGAFPCYSDGPLQPAWDRVLQVGDASAAQSPLSFGGFGSLMRHLPRLTGAVDQALREDRLSRADLSWIHPYQPSLSASWLFQRSMSVAVGQVAIEPPPLLPFPALSSRQPAAAALPTAQAQAQAQATARSAVATIQPAAPAAGCSTAIATTPALVQEQPAAVIQLAAAVGSNGSTNGSTHRSSSSASSSTTPGCPPAASVPLTGTSVALASTSPAIQRPSSPPSSPPPSTPPSSSSPRLPSSPPSTFPPWARLPPSHVNDVLAANFSVMKLLGDRVLRPFLQDTIQLVPLGLAMTGMLLRNPVAISRVLLQVGPVTLLSWFRHCLLVQVGPVTLLSWFRHYLCLIAYTLLYVVLKPIVKILPRKLREHYQGQRVMEGLHYGSGLDYHCVPAPGA